MTKNIEEECMVATTNELVTTRKFAVRGIAVEATVSGRRHEMVWLDDFGTLKDMFYAIKKALSDTTGHNAREVERTLLTAREVKL